MLEGMGFSPPQDVQGRTSIADLFKPDNRCGIYVLHFANDESYAGQAVDVTRRYVQHCKVHHDIKKISFKRVQREKLNDEERTVIWHLEQNGWKLRNVTFTSIPKGESDFDLIMEPEEQQRWLNDLTYIDDSGDRIVAPVMRRKYSGRFHRFLQMPHADGVIDILRQYVTTGIPAIRRGEMSFWSCTCLPTERVYTRVNIYWQEVFTVVTFEDELWFSFHLAHSPLEQSFGTSLTQLFRRHSTAEHIDMLYKPGGPDQICIQVPEVAAAKAFIKESGVLAAIRLFNLRLMQKGPCTYGRYHCMDLADQVIVPDEQRTRIRQGGTSPLPHGSNRPAHERRLWRIMSLFGFRPRD